MKILTNIRFAQTAGIAQVVFAFLNFVENGKDKNLKIIAVNIANKIHKEYRKTNGKKISTISIGMKIPNIAKIVDKAKNLAEVEKRYEKVINIYQDAIRDEKPDIILINGTYFMPWCLFLAAKRECTPAVLHYHGVLTKETESWKKHQKKLFLEMERSFDSKDLPYIFPSKIAKKIVEKEVFGHKIKNCHILPNPVSEHFFSPTSKPHKKNIGIVTRWTNIKNVHFCEKLAKYNHRMGAKFVINMITDLNSKNEKYKKLSRIIKFKKPTNNTKLAAFYRNMGVLISPSHFETYGNVAKEALMSGTPAIVNKNMGVSETYKILGLHDWIISFKSVKKVYDKIESLIGQTVNNETKNNIKTAYHPDRIFAQLISILDNSI